MGMGVVGTASNRAEESCFNSRRCSVTMGMEGAKRAQRRPAEETMEPVLKEVVSGH